MLDEYFSEALINHIRCVYTSDYGSENTHNRALEDFFDALNRRLDLYTFESTDEISKPQPEPQPKIELKW